MQNWTRFDSARDLSRIECASATKGASSSLVSKILGATHCLRQCLFDSASITTPHPSAKQTPSPPNKGEGICLSSFLNSHHLQKMVLHAVWLHRVFDSRSFSNVCFRLFRFVPYCRADTLGHSVDGLGYGADICRRLCSYSINYRACAQA